MPAYTKDGDLISLLSFLKKEKTGQKCPTYDFTYPRNTVPRSINLAYLK